MTSISSVGNMQSFNPLSRLQDELTSEVSAGTISADDQSALSSALNDIDASMQSDGQSGTRPSPGSMKTKIDNLIAGEVSDGKLTSAQAQELKNVFANAFKGGPGGPGGPPPSDSSSTSGTLSSSSSNIDQVMQDFLKLIQDSQGSSGSSYSASGSSLLSQIQSLIVNSQA